MRPNPSKQLALYHQLSKSPNFAEVEMMYKSMVKPSERSKITCSRDSYEVLRNIYDSNRIEYIEQFIMLLLNRANKVLG